MALVALALLYGATAAALAAAVWRFDPRPSLAATLGLSLLPLAFTWWGFLPQRTLAPSIVVARVPPWADPRLAAQVERRSSPHNPLLLDLASQVIPWDRAARDGLLFNPSQGAGAALLGNGQSAVLFPTEALSRLLPPFRAVTYKQAARLLVAAWGMFVLVRLLGYGDLAGVVAAAVFVGSGFLQLWRLHPPALVASTAPWIVAAAVALLCRPGPGPAIALGAAGAAGALAGHPETLLHVALFALMVAPLLARNGGARRGAAAPRSVAPAVPSPDPEPGAHRPARGNGAPPLRATLGWAAASAALAVLLAAPALLPLIENLRHSVEWVEFREERRGDLERVPLEWALERLKPAGAVLALGDPRRDTWVGQENLAELGGGALGAPALFLALVGFAAERRRHWPLLTVGLVGLLVSVHLPVLSAPVAWIPLLRDSLLTRLSLWWVLAGSILAAAGTAAARSRTLRPAWPLAAASAVGIVVALAQADAPAGEPARIRALELAPLLGVLVVVTLAARERDRSGGSGTPEVGSILAACVILAALVVPRGVLFARWIPVTPADGFYPEAPSIERVASGLAELPPVGYRVSGKGSALAPHSAAFYGFDEIRFYDALTFAPYARFLAALGPPPRFGWVAFTSGTGPVLDYLGVRFLFDQPAARRERNNRLVHRGEDAVVWERRGALPRAFFPRAIEVERDAGVAVERAKRVADFSELAIAGCDVAGGANSANPRANPDADSDVDSDADSPARTNPDAQVLDLVVGRGEIRATVEVSGPNAVSGADALLVTSQPAIPGWRLLVDGERAPDRGCRVNGAFLGALVPPGMHRVELRYRPRAWPIGLAMAGGGIVLALGLAWQGRSPAKGAGPAKSLPWATISTRSTYGESRAKDGRV